MLLGLGGAAMVIVGVLFLPIVHGNGGGDGAIPVSEWEVAVFLFRYLSAPLGMLFVLPLLSVPFIAATSLVGIGRPPSPRLILWRRCVACAGLFLQATLGLFGAVIYSFSFNLGAGFLLVLLGFVIMTVGTFRTH
jgi:hypothetical protein